jgi:hypothetical protein
MTSSLGVRELDAYRLNHLLAGYGLRLRSRRTASERQVKARVGERTWERRSLFWLEPLPAGEGAVPELTRAAPEEPSGQGGDHDARRDVGLSGGGAQWGAGGRRGHVDPVRPHWL